MAEENKRLCNNVRKRKYQSKAPFTLHVGPEKIARTLLGRLLCERKHVPGLIPVWGPSNIAGFSPGTSSV